MPYDVALLYWENLCTRSLKQVESSSESRKAISSMLKLLGDQTQVKFDKVLLLQDGKTAKVLHMKGCTVHGEVIGQVKGPKVIAYKYKKCKNSRRTVGHRQKYSRVKITKIAHA